MSDAGAQKVETLIVGAGVIGSSVAMHLAQKGMTGIRVIDFDLEGSLSSSELNAGGVRAGFSEQVNVEMSKVSISYYDQIGSEVGYRPSGYLWLVGEGKLQTAEQRVRQEHSSEWPVSILSLPELRARCEFLDKDGLSGAVFSARDGLINPNLLKNYYRTQAKALGVQFDDRTLIREVAEGSTGASTGASLVCKTQKYPSQISYEKKLDVLSPKATFSEGTAVGVTYLAERIVNCAGPWASQAAEVMHYESPVAPVRRQVSLFDCREVDLTPHGMIVDTSGVYFHPEGTHILAGFANQEPVGANFVYEGEGFFQEHIWSALEQRSTAFERLKHVSGWAGLYEVSPDHCPVVGRVGKSERMFEAHSFSGRGVMHSYAAGLAMAELIVDKKYETIDLNCLSADRFKSGQLLNENRVI